MIIIALSFDDVSVRDVIFNIEDEFECEEVALEDEWVDEEVAIVMFDRVEVILDHII